MLQTIAEKERLHYSATLTGFKWIGNESIRLQRDGFHVLFSYEEAIGYCVGDVICDKDGISAAIVVSELVNTLAQQNKTLLQYYHDIQAQYGLFVSYNTYLFSYNKEVTKQIFHRLRNYNSNGYWKLSGDVEVKRIRDVTLGYDSAAENGVSSLPTTPESEMLMYEFSNNCTLIIRTSGTEPKIKLYSEMVSNQQSNGDNTTNNDHEGDVNSDTNNTNTTANVNNHGSQLNEEQIKSNLKQFIESLIHEMIQPDVHGLTRP